MLTTKEAELLLKEPKISTTSTKKIVDLKKTKIVLDLISESDDKLKFKLQITQSKRIQFKLTTHHSFEAIGLLRLDFKGRHRNPYSINDHVPVELHKYLDKEFGLDEPHVHIYVEGFGLNWAKPIEDYGFAITQIKSLQDKISIIEEFQEKINLKTKLFFDLPLFE